MVKTNGLPAIAAIAFLASAPAQAQQSSMSFFVTCPTRDVRFTPEPVAKLVLHG